MEDLEVGPVVEDAAAGAGEDAPSRAGTALLQVLSEERDQQTSSAQLSARVPDITLIPRKRFSPDKPDAKSGEPRGETRDPFPAHGLDARH